MPIINWISVNDNDEQSNAELVSLAKERIDEVANSR